MLLMLQAHECSAASVPHEAHRHGRQQPGGSAQLAVSPQGDSYADVAESRTQAAPRGSGAAPQLLRRDPIPQSAAAQEAMRAAPEVPAWQQQQRRVPAGPLGNLNMERAPASAGSPGLDADVGVSPRQGQDADLASLNVSYPLRNATHHGPAFVNGRIQTFIVKVQKIGKRGASAEPGVVDTPLWKGQGCYNDPCEKVPQNPCWNNSCWIEATGISNWCADSLDNCRQCGGLWCHGDEKEGDIPERKKEPGAESHFLLEEKAKENAEDAQWLAGVAKRQPEAIAAQAAATAENLTSTAAPTVANTSEVSSNASGNASSNVSGNNNSSGNDTKSSAGTYGPCGAALVVLAMLALSW